MFPEKEDCLDCAHPVDVFVLLLAAGLNNLISKDISSTLMIIRVIPEIRLCEADSLCPICIRYPLPAGTEGRPIGDRRYGSYLGGSTWSSADIKLPN